MTEQDGVIDISGATTGSATPADESSKDFYSDIPEPEASEESAPSEVAEETEVQEEKPEQSKKGAEARIRQLNEQRKAEQQRADSLARQLEEMQAMTQFQQPQYDFNQPYAETATAEEVEARAVQKALAISELQYQQRAHAQRVQQEANEAMNQYPELNPDSDQHDPELSEAITEAGLAYVRANPTKSLKAYINKLMSPYKRSVQKEVGNLASTVTKQVAQQALRPTSTPKGEKRPEDMTIEELEARLGKVY